jgi:NAD-dependent SIR2 family protein deacetylase
MTRERPNRNVYVLGAGFSAPAGAPVIRDFLDRSRELYDDPRSSMDGPERERFARVFEFKRSMGQAREKFRIDLDDIEKLFGLVEISQRLGENIGQTRDDLVYLIAKTLQVATTWPTAKRPTIIFSAHPDPAILQVLGQFGGVFRNPAGSDFNADMYDYFAGLVAGLLDDPDRRTNRKDTIVTFNYDLICDHALRRLGVTPNYHLDQDLLSTSEGFKPSRTVDLLKLHGSTNWGICTDCNGSVTILPEKLTEDPDGFRRLTCPKCKMGAYQPLLIPPSWDKSEYRNIVKRIWSKAVEELRKATRICVIGYSMPEADAFFQYLLTLALSQNDGLYRLIVVDRVQRMPSEPDSLSTKGEPLSPIEKRYRQMLDPMFQERRFSFHGDGVQGFLGNRRSLEDLGRGEMVADRVSLC